MAGQGGTGDCEEQGRRKGGRQTKVALCDDLQRVESYWPGSGSKTARREEARHHQEDLDCDATVVIKPCLKLGGETLKRLGQGTIGRKVVQQDQLGGQRLEGVDQGEASRGQGRGGWRGFW